MRIPFRGREPRVAETAWLAPDVVLVGEVEIGPESSIWFGAVLRGDTDRIQVGPDSNIQDGCVVHVDPGSPVVIGRGVSVGHRAVLHGCHVEDDVLIGMGAVVMNGVRIGAGSIVGAGAVLASGMAFPPGSLVLGIPGRARGQITDEQLAATKRNARDYKEVARSMRVG